MSCRPRGLPWFVALFRRDSLITDDETYAVDAPNELPGPPPPDLAFASPARARQEWRAAVGFGRVEGVAGPTSRWQSWRQVIWQVRVPRRRAAQTL